MKFSNWGKWLTKISLLVTVIPQIIQILSTIFGSPAMPTETANGISVLGLGGMAMGNRKGTAQVEKKTALLLTQQPHGIPAEKQDAAVEKMESGGKA